MNEYVVNIRDRLEGDEHNYVYVGRPSKWGNPYTHLGGIMEGDRARVLLHVPTRDLAVEAYETWVRQQPDLLAALDELRGKVLGCWCAPLPCHADVLVKLLRETER